MALREVPLVKNVELKCMQINKVKSVTMTTKRGSKQTDGLWACDMDAVDG